MANFYDQITIGLSTEINGELYKNSKKGYIKINIFDSVTSIDIYGNKVNVGTLSDFLFQSSFFLSDLPFDFLASIATDKFYDEFPALYARSEKEYISKREFLFSDECVSKEIKEHCEAYWWATGNPLVPANILVLGVIATKGLSSAKSSIITSCREIDIFEQDAAKVRDRTAFGYFSGIRQEYKNTYADPYWHPNGVRTYQNVREDWKTKKISKTV